MAALVVMAVVIMMPFVFECGSGVFECSSGVLCGMVVQGSMLSMRVLFSKACLESRLEKVPVTGRLQVSGRHI